MSGNTWPTQGGDAATEAPAHRAPIAPAPPPIVSPHKPKKQHRTGASSKVTYISKKSSNTVQGPTGRRSAEKSSLLKPTTDISTKVVKPSSTTQVAKPLRRFPIRPLHEERANDKLFLEQANEDRAVALVAPSHSNNHTRPVTRTSGTSRWDKTLSFTIRSSQISVTRGSQLFYVKKAGKEYVHYYDNRQPTKAYLVARVRAAEVEMLKVCSSHDQIISLLGDDLLEDGLPGHCLFEIPRSQDLCQVYEFASASLEENTIWYIAGEVLKAINFLHGRDIVLNTLKCELVLAINRSNRCHIQIGKCAIDEHCPMAVDLTSEIVGNVAEFSNVEVNKEMRKGRDIRHFGHLVYELTNGVPFDDNTPPQLRFGKGRLEHFVSLAISRKHTARQLQIVWKDFFFYTPAIMLELVALVDGATYSTLQDHGVIREADVDSSHQREPACCF
ncbi:hypothetical protein TWF481_006237 [Arthrobotrys musiformis]|uniref:Protein kinase domain-containing protein n=1 Tax=Arthrobotrys musiformis TaxID=47236 RepID=A0AAV9WHA2_9PEZI